jgi:hypothetical protein
MPASWEGILEMKWLLAEALTLLCMGLKMDPYGFEILHQVGRPREQVENLEVTLSLCKDQRWFFFLIPCIDKRQKLIKCEKRCKHAKDRLLSLKTVP